MTISNRTKFLAAAVYGHVHRNPCERLLERRDAQIGCKWSPLGQLLFAAAANLVLMGKLLLTGMKILISKRKCLWATGSK